MADVGPDFRKSDRYVTPGVIMVALFIAGFLLAVVAGSVAYLTARGIDPDPMIKLVTTVGGALFSLGTFVLQLVNRPTAAKTERNTGVLASAVYEVADKMPQPVPRHAAADTAYLDMSAAPAPRGS